MSEAKKYKLIKVYPGSKPLGTVEEVVMYNGMIFTNDASKLYNIYPEFWEEVKEEKLCVPVGTRFKYHAYASTVFKIGSLNNTRVVVTWTDINGTEKSIDYTIYTANESFKNGHWIECKPLFKTEDDVDIYEDSELWWLRITQPEPTSRDTLWGIGEFKSPKSNRSTTGAYKWFSTKEAAENYIKWNKPAYSAKQVIESVADVLKREGFIKSHASDLAQRIYNRLKSI